MLIGLVFSAPAVQAREYHIGSMPGGYQASIRIDTESCNASQCSGPARVRLFGKGGHLVQSFDSGEMSALSEADTPEEAKKNLSYDSQDWVVIDDFNFDGAPDIAIRNGNHSSYSGPSFDVYVFNRSRGRFIGSEDLSKLAHEALGLFKVDHDRKRLVTFEKDGCCLHVTTEYAVEPGKGLLVMRRKEEAADTDGEHVLVTTSHRINGKMTTTSRRYLIKDYYKESLDPDGK